MAGADVGYPTDGPVWTVVGYYADNFTTGVYHIHARDAKDHMLEQIDRGVDTGVIDSGFMTVAIFSGAHHDLS